MAKPALAHRSWKTRLRRILVRVRRTLPPGTRLPVGIVLMVGGLLGFLPILGFWMLPLGIAVASLDITHFRARLRARK